MVPFETLQTLALSLPESTEEPHFDKTSFRVRKKIFATYDAHNHKASVKFSEINQDLFCAEPNGAIYPVPNKWGLLGWTILDLNVLETKVFEQALKTAFCDVAPKKLTELVELM
ncbi:MmcQ/YjbR family DNA-binding protein [bacterium]|nr:MAG: MmcQ/YjbR family DNA-binding protein [bacterium]